MNKPFGLHGLSKNISAKIWFNSNPDSKLFKYPGELLFAYFALFMRW